MQSRQIELVAPLDTANKGEAARAAEPLPDREPTLLAITKDLSDEKVPEAAEKAEKIVSTGERRFGQLRMDGYSPKRALEIAKLHWFAGMAVAALGVAVLRMGFFV